MEGYTKVRELKKREKMAIKRTYKKLDHAVLNDRGRKHGRLLLSMSIYPLSLIVFLFRPKSIAVKAPTLPLFVAILSLS